MKRLFLTLLAATLLLVPIGCTGGTDTPSTLVPVPSPTTTPNPLPPPEVIPETPSVSVEMQKRLDRLVEKLEQERQLNNVPGMALAVIMDDRVVLAQGFGLADIKNEIPATADTTFAIGSSTKAFTATAIGMLVDDGLMDWDDPVTDYLPYLELKIESQDPNAEVLIRDLLSHRTGYPRLSILTINDEVTREEALRTMSGGEPLAGFREKFYYCNEMYLAAGVAAGEAAGADWDTLIANRIFAPLGMTRSGTTFAAAQEDRLLAKGYLWQEALDDWEDIPMQSVDCIGPAGSINSNVLDMAQWLRFQLAGGVYNGTRLLSEEQHRETWTKQTDIIENYNYGLGWFIGEWEGRPVIEHGGNVEGFSATVAMLPESNIGFVLLSNASVSPLQQTSLGIVWQALLGDMESPTETSDNDNAAFLGRYINQHGPLAGRVYTVIEKNGGLALDANGETIYDLKPPDENGVRYFVLTDRAAVSFERDASGAVNTLNVIQDGMTFDIPREGTEFTPEIDLAAQQRYLGSYHSEELNLTTEVKIQNNRLAIDWPGETVYELYPPNEDNIWVFRMTPAFTLTFNEDESGNVVGLTYYQADKEFPMERLSGDGGVTLPTVAEILALRNTDQRNAALASWGIYRLNGIAYYLHAGVSGETTTTIDGYDRARSETDFGKFGTSVSVILVDDNEVWSQAFNRPLRQLHGNQLTQALRGFPSSDFGDWSRFFDEIQVKRQAELDGVAIYVLQAQAADLPPQTFYIDASNGDILRSEGVVLATGDVPIYIVNTYEDYRDVDGVRMAFRTTSFNDQNGRTVWEMRNVETNLAVSDDTFNLTQ